MPKLRSIQFLMRSNPFDRAAVETSRETPRVIDQTRRFFLAAAVTFAACSAESDPDVVGLPNSSFELFTHCRPVGLVSLQIMSSFGDVDEQLSERSRRTIESRLRSAGIYDSAWEVGSENPILNILVDYEDMGTMEDPMEVRGFTLILRKRLYDPASMLSSYPSTYYQVPRFIGLVSRTSSGASPAILLELRKAVDDFITEYLRVNEKACKALE